MKLITVFLVLGFSMALCNTSGRLNSSNTPANTGPNTAAPTKENDRESVKNDLVRLVNDVADASVEGDIALLSRVTTDDFELTDVNGKVQNKNEALADVKKERTIKSWTITEADLSTLASDTAILKYVLSVKLKNGRSGKARVTDTFSKKDGSWLLRSSQQTLIR